MGDVGARHLRGLRPGAEDGPGDDLDQRHAGPVVVDDGVVGPVDASRRPDVGQFAGVLLHVSTFDLDHETLPVDLQIDPAVEGDRFVVLGGLEVLGHVRVEVVLPREPAPRRDPAPERQADADRGFDGFRVDHGKRARQAEAHGAGLGVRFRPELGGAAAEHLRFRVEFDVHLQPERRVVVLDDLVEVHQVRHHHTALVPSRGFARVSSGPSNLSSRVASMKPPTR